MTVQGIASRMRDRRSFAFRSIRSRGSRGDAPSRSERNFCGFGAVKPSFLTVRLEPFELMVRLTDTSSRSTRISADSAPWRIASGEMSFPASAARMALSTLVLPRAFAPLAMVPPAHAVMRRNSAIAALA